MRAGVRGRFGADKYSGLLSTPSPFVLMPGYESSVERLIETALPSAWTIADRLAISGYDATMAEWPSRGFPSPGVAFALSGGVNAQTIAEKSALAGTRDLGVKFAGAGGAADGAACYRLNDASRYSLRLHDAYVEALVRFPIATPGQNVVFSQKVVATTYPAYQVRFINNTGPRFQLDLQGDAGHQILIASGARTLGEFAFCSSYVNRDEDSVNGAGTLVNAGALSQYNPIGVAGYDFLGDYGPMLGAYSTAGAFASGAIVYYLSIVLGSNLWSAGAAGAAEFIALHQERNAMIWASKPKYSKYSIPRPTSSGTTIASYQTKRLDDGTSRLFLMGANSPRFEKGVDLAGTPYVGAVIEGAVVNACYNYNTLTTGWGFIRASCSTTPVVCLDGVTRTANTVKENGTAASTHHADTPVYALVNGVAVGCYVDIKASNRSKLSLNYQRSGAGIAATVFDLVAGTATTTAGVGGIISKGGGYYRCWVAGVTSGAGDYYGIVYILNEAGVALFNGLDQDSLTISEAMVYLGSYPPEVVPNTTALVTKPADNQSYPITEGHEIGVGKGALAIKYYAPIFTPTAALYLGAFHDGTANNHIVPYIDTDGCFKALTRKTAGNNGDAAGAANRCDGYIHEGMICWAAGRLWVIDEGVASAEDNVVDIPTGLTTFSLGSNSTPANHAGPIRIIQVRTHRQPVSWGDRWM
jgi:hypothetical protein